MRRVADGREVGDHVFIAAGARIGRIGATQGERIGIARGARRTTAVDDDVVLRV